MITKEGEWWTGTEAADIADFLKGHWPGSIGRVLFCKCDCRSEHFYLSSDENEGVAIRICAVCGNEHFIWDSEEFWHNAEPGVLECQCRNKVHELAVAVEFEEDYPGEVKRVIIGHRCLRCGLLGSNIDWPVTQAHSDQLEQLV